MDNKTEKNRKGPVLAIVEKFLDGKLSLMLIIIAGVVLGRSRREWGFIAALSFVVAIMLSVLQWREVDQLVDAGLVTDPSSLFDLDVGELADLPRWQERSAEKLVAELLGMGADVIALQEVENDPAHAPIETLVRSMISSSTLAASLQIASSSLKAPAGSR